MPYQLDSCGPRLHPRALGRGLSEGWVQGGWMGDLTRTRPGRGCITGKDTVLEHTWPSLPAQAAAAPAAS